MGFAKAFGLASLEQLRVPISRPMGVLWLVAAVLLIAAVAALFTAPRWFWLVGALGLVASQTAIIASWGDARFGTIPNVVLLATVIYAAFAWGPFGLRAEYERLVRSGLAQAATSMRPQDITEADLAVLPPLVQRYLRFAGVVGTPHVQGFRARLTGRIRKSATAPWMPFVAEQHNFYDPPRRYFWMEATRGGLPVDGLHAYDGRQASVDDLVLLERAASGKGVTPILITDKNRLDTVAELVAQGNTVQLRDPCWRKELIAWIRFNEREARRTLDGLWSRTSGNPEMPRALGELLLRIVLSPRSQNRKDVPWTRNSAGVLVVVSDVDDAPHWIEAGRCYERFALQATALGLRNAFINQPVEVATLREQLATWLGVGSRRLDLVVRFGYGPEMPKSFRRPVTDVLSAAG
jgi:hypothetical protein